MAQGPYGGGGGGWQGGQGPQGPPQQQGGYPQQQGGYPQQQGGYPQQQGGYPQQQGGYPQQQGGYPQQQGGAPQQQGGVPAAPVPKKKGKAGIILLVLALVVPALGFGGWMYYQRYINWGYANAPDSVKSLVDPRIEVMGSVAEKAARACGDGDFKTNPAQGTKLDGDDDIKAVWVECPDARAKSPDPFPPLAGQRGIFDVEVTIRNQEEFLCMPPNFLGLDDSTRSDCVMWKGSRVHYAVKRSAGGGTAEVHIEME